MNKLLTALAAVSVMTLSASAFAEQQLTMAQMDAVTAGGSAIGDAEAYAFGASSLASTYVDTLTEATEVVDPQFGSFYNVHSFAQTIAEAGVGGIAGVSGADGTTYGDYLSDTESYSGALADADRVTSVYPTAAATAYNTSVAASLLLPASAGSYSSAASVLSK